MRRAVVNDSMGERAKRMPPRPRAILNGVTLLPQMSASWEPVKDSWVLPGRAVRTTKELRDYATAEGLAFYVLT